ncbi:MAG: SIMPL domain-containing protein [Candidatus Omnitrophota bacterium]
MEGARVLRNSQIIILGVCIAVATIVSSVILSQGFLKVMKFSREAITVTGSANRDIRSDYIVWKCSFSRTEAELETAYRKLNRDLTRVKQYLASQGVDEKEEAVSQVSIATIYKKNERGSDTNEIMGYRLSQAVEIRSSDVDKITVISRQSSELINEGIEFASGAPEYFYTKLDDLKIEMLASASENAKQRAENMVKATGNRIGLMRSARMGVFQITPRNSTEVSDWGISDTSSLEKKVTAVVSASFAIE